MSGGSYNYLCNREAGEILDGQGASDLVEMRDALRERGVLDAAGQTDAVIATIAEARQLVEMRLEALRDVWKAVEWHDSGDWGPERIDGAIAEYRRRRST